MPFCLQVVLQRFHHGAPRGLTPPVRPLFGGPFSSPAVVRQSGWRTHLASLCRSLSVVAATLPGGPRRRHVWVNGASGSMTTNHFAAGFAAKICSRGGRCY